MAAQTSPAFQESLSDAKLKKFDVLLIYKINKLSRLPRFFPYLAQSLQNLDPFRAKYVVFPPTYPRSTIS